MRKAITLGVLLCLAGGARANDEYVNPRFCYRVVQPAGVQRAVPRADGTGITLDMGGASIDIAAGYPRHAGELPRAHGYYQAMGWTAGTPIRKTIAGTPWVTYLLTKDGQALSLHEYVRRRGQPTYVVTARYPRSDGARVRSDVSKLLASWRWISACI